MNSYWTNYLEKLVLPPVSMYLAEQYGNKREDL